VKFKGFFVLSIVLALIIVLLDFFAFKYFWYWRFYWFDKTMHFLAGFLITLTAIQLCSFFSKKPLTGWRLIFLSLLPTLAVGIFWEFFEFTTLRFYFSEVVLKDVGMLYGGWRDALRDIFFDVFGSLTASSLFIANLLIWKKIKAV